MKLHWVLLLWLVLALELTRADGWNGRCWHGGREQRAYNDNLDTVISNLRHRNEGRVLSIEILKEGGRSVYSIRILNAQGRVRRLHFDGATGRLLPYSGWRSKYRNRSYPYRDCR